MKRCGRSIFAIAAFAAVLTTILPSASGARDDPAYQTGSFGIDALFGIAKSQTRNHLSLETGSLFEQEHQAEHDAYAGILANTFTPQVRFTPGGDDVAAHVAGQAVASGDLHMSVAQATTFLNERETEYEKAMAGRGLPANSLTSACAYLVDGLYVAGTGSRPSPGDFDGFRATCVLEIGKAEKLALLRDEEPLTNGQRFHVGRAVAMIGGALRDLAAEPSRQSDVRDEARSVFHSTFGFRIDEVPASRFVCVLSTEKLADCDVIVSRYGARLPEIAQRNS